MVRAPSRGLLSRGIRADAVGPGPVGQPATRFPPAVITAAPAVPGGDQAGAAVRVGGEGGHMTGSGSRARSAAPTRPALLPSWAPRTSATGRQLPPTSQRL